MATAWSIDVSWSAKFECSMPDSSNTVTRSKRRPTKYTETHFLWGGHQKHWSAVMDEEKGFIKDDRITIEVRLSVANKKGIINFPRVDFTDSTEPSHDVTLVVEGEKIYVSRQILAVHSPFFKSMFFGNFDERDKKEIVLNDVNREEFLDMLNLIYSMRKKITDCSAEPLLKLGDRFLIACVVTDPNFTDPNEPSHDVTLLIEGEKIYVNKGILSVHSSFFKAMIYGKFDEKDKKEIELKGIDREEFLELLRLIYPFCKMTTVDKAEFLLELGDRFQINCVIQQVEQLLIDSTRVSILEKLRIADKYRLDVLLDHCLLSLVTAKDFENVQESSIYRDLSIETTRALFERVVKTIK